VGGARAGYEYARTGNPTRTALETCLAVLEGGRYGRAFASGMAATDVLLRAICRPGDHIVIPNDAYGGTFRLIDKVLRHWGIEHTAVSQSDLGAVRAAMLPTTRVLWCETPTNPLLSIADIAGLAGIAHEFGACLVVDNTFATPYLQAPLGLGADVVVHSTTKYLGGHSDVIGGALVTDDAAVDEQVAFLQNGAGAVPGPFDAWLTLRGIKTLAVRMERHSDNAERVVAALQAHPAVGTVHYPGLDTHPGHEVAAKQMRRFGGMVSFTVRAGAAAALAVCARTQLFTLAESLGGVESLIEHPGRMTHASTAGTQLEVPADLIRLSVGIEDAEDLVDDLLTALS
jgi:cystathionine gamma-synthase